jgi:hypothetical protein
VFGFVPPRAAHSTDVSRVIMVLSGSSAVGPLAVRSRVHCRNREPAREPNSSSLRAVRVSLTLALRSARNQSPHDERGEVPHVAFEQKDAAPEGGPQAPASIPRVGKTGNGHEWRRSTGATVRARPWSPKDSAC